MGVSSEVPAKDLESADRPPSHGAVPVWLPASLAPAFASFLVFAQHQIRSPDNRTIFGVLVAVQFIFSGLHVLSNPALRYIPPFVYAALRLAVALPFMRRLAILEGGLPHIPPSDWPYCLALGVFGCVLPQGLLFLGLKMIGPALCAVFQPSIPVWCSALGAAAGLERLTPMKSLGIACAVGGALLLLGVEQAGASPSSSPFLGIMVMIVQSSSYACYLVLLQWKLRTVPYPISLFYKALEYGLAIVAFIALFSLPSVQWGAPAWAWASVLYAGIVATSVAHSANSWVVRHGGSVLPALFTVLQPPLSTLGAVLFLGMSFDFRDFGGLILIVAGKSGCFSPSSSAHPATYGCVDLQGCSLL